MEKSTVISKDFFSNCLIEAVKAKLKDWKNVKIIFIPKKYNSSNTCHFLWKNNTTTDVFEFVSDKEKHNTIFSAFFEKGHIIKTPWERHNRFIQIGVQRKISALEKKLENKMNFISINDYNQKYVDKYSWHNFEEPSEDGYVVCMIDNIPKLFEIRDSTCIDTDNKKEIKWDNIPLTKWKYI